MELNAQKIPKECSGYGCSKNPEVFVKATYFEDAFGARFPEPVVIEVYSCVRCMKKIQEEDRARLDAHRPIA